VFADRRTSVLDTRFCFPACSAFRFCSIAFTALALGVVWEPRGRYDLKIRSICSSIFEVFLYCLAPIVLVQGMDLRFNQMAQLQAAVARAEERDATAQGVLRMVLRDTRNPTGALMLGMEGAAGAAAPAGRRQRGRSRGCRRGGF
jgi:hypothetical protein